ncbi:hypothetical protein M8J75_015368 [Diaphorina citri]|nr:hypothetical protein M8J75_015368 [Diaphorina citri]
MSLSLPWEVVKKHKDYCSLNSSFWGKFGPTSKEVHFVYGTFLMIIGVAGVVGNSLVLFVFSRYRRLKGPFSAFIINLAISDLCTACLHFMPAFSSFQNQWAFGHSGCVFYAFGVGHFGLLSIVILSVIAVERYMVLTTKPFSGTWKITECGARKEQQKSTPSPAVGAAEIYSFTCSRSSRNLRLSPAVGAAEIYSFTCSRSSRNLLLHLQ